MGTSVICTSPPPSQKTWNTSHLLSIIQDLEHITFLAHHRGLGTHHICSPIIENLEHITFAPPPSQDLEHIPKDWEHTTVDEGVIYNYHLSFSLLGTKTKWFTKHCQQLSKLFFFIFLLSFLFFPPTRGEFKNIYVIQSYLLLLYINYITAHLSPIPEDLEHTTFVLQSYLWFPMILTSFSANDYDI